MLDHDTLLERTESYLKALVAGVSDSLGTDFDACASFGDLGIDSFRVLKIIKALEADFGTLPKTLLFENFNVEALARYLVDRHRPTLTAKFSPSGAATQAPPVAPAPPVAQPTMHPTAAARRTPIRLLEKDLARYPELQALVRDLFERHKNEGGVSRGTRNIAPHLFIGSDRRGYFNYSRYRDTVLIYAYTGPADYFPELGKEMLHYCDQKQLQLNVFTDEPIAPIDGVAFSATPFGVLQRVLDLQSFTLDGGAMRRLRYQVSKFEKAGAGRTQEYKCGTDKAVDESIAAIIDKWCATKTMVNPLVHMVKGEILAGTLHPQHRIFLTYLDDVLQNVILISAMCRELNGYLMDLEFYSRDMPLGGLEYAIVNIIGTLVAEGCSMFSLGGTYGCRLVTSDNADPEVDKILDDLHRQNIFNDESNLQFKNKFRPENRTIYLCRPVGTGHADKVIDIIMMIADPSKEQTPDDDDTGGAAAPPVLAVAAPADGKPQPHSTTLAIEDDARSRTLAEVGFNPLAIPSDRIDFDLLTDSWSQLDAPFVDKQMRHLHAQLQQPVDLQAALQTVFPFKHFVLTDAGRTSDHVFCSAWPKKGIVLQNLLFPSCIYHQIDKGLTPCELPHPALFRLDSDAAFKGDLNWDGVQEYVASRSADIAYVCIEVNDNAAGGQPVSIEHLRQVKELLTRHSIALVIDGTRILENARCIIDHDPQQAGRTMFEVARDVLSLADAVIGSLTKDFCVDKGGFIATNDEALLRRCQDVIRQQGGGLGVIDKKLVAQSLHHRAHIERQVLRRMQAAKSIWHALKAHDVPLVHPAGAHCVLVDVKRMPEFAQLEHPVVSFLAWLYRATGIRAGAHSVGMQRGTALNGLVRLAIPVGLAQEQADEIAGRMIRAFADRRDIPELSPEGAGTPAPGDVHARFALVRYHHPACAVLASAATQSQAAAGATPQPCAQPAMAPARPASIPEPAPVTLAAASQVDARRKCGDVAIVGMAGRYPKSKTLTEFWDNLRQGRDCIVDLPQERMARRVQNTLARQYRGGFIDDVDKFDSLFFNISPREAEALDPQERLFLEVAYEALEDAGYYPEILAAEGAPRRVGVFVGAVWAMYQMAAVEQKLAGNDVNTNSFLWSIANRVSYWMNLCGPSLTLDTACSSSLTALWLACEAIRNGDCSSAIVGGVNLDLHQHKFDINSVGGALSADGVCRSFGAGANGYVAGEGVGALFIKPLDQAIEDRDHVYGVIKSIVVNHGGRTGGYTVPSPKAQGDLVAAAFEKAGVDPRSIGYLEAHGTGTELGDPIEIAGLMNAFDGRGVADRSCPIGSVKTNIGHLEAAAGVVGVCKVLLQMTYRQLVPSLHSAHLNEHIDFDRSPFYVQQRLQDWMPKEIDRVRHPLRAGISSFGAGGANAHVIIEAHEAPQPDGESPPLSCVIPLSARSDEQLREVAQRLHRHLRLDFIRTRLDDIAFTLQNGRKSFEHRLAIVANTRDELIDKLGLFVAGQSDADILTGHARASEEITKLLSRTEKEQFLRLLSQGGDAHKLARLWTDGLLSDWRGLPPGAGRRASLPTYPFADKRHWVGTGKAAIPAFGAQAHAAVHPLIDSNESTFRRQLFRKTFRAHEFFLRDHVVSDIPTLPGVAYLDLARKAGEIAAGRAVRTIRNVTWVSPLSVQGHDEAAATQALIELKPVADAVAFEVFSEGEDGRRKVYAQGKLTYADERSAAPQAETIDLAAIRARCPKAIAGKDAYPLFRSVGLEYGRSFQALQEIYKGDDEVLGRLELPDVRDADFDQFVLHPCILDAAMQAGVVAQLADGAGDMKVPYSIGEVEILHPLTRICYSHVTKVAADRNTGSGVSRENVTIVDPDGKVLARIRESVGVPLVSVHEKPAAARSEAFKRLYYAHAWRPSPLAVVPSEVRSVLILDTGEGLRNACAALHVDAVLVMPGSRFEDLGNNSYRVDPGDRQDYVRLFQALGVKGVAPQTICYAWPESAVPENEDSLTKALERGPYAFLSLCQALIEQKPQGRSRLLYLYATEKDGDPAHNQAMNGFARSLRLEHPKIDCKVLEIRPPRSDVDGLASLVLAELDASAQSDITVRYDNGVRYARTLERVDAAVLEEAASPGLALKQGGVYLITGGAGGLGLIFAEFLARQCRARLVLTGRSPPSAENEARFDGFRKAGAEVMYVRADVSKQDDVRRVLAQCRSSFGAIDGIIHAAGVLRDSLLRKKTRDEMRDVFAPKVYGTFHLDEQTREDDLDFFVVFSSLAAIGGNAGQCDYAFANHYADSFAAVREERRAAGKRRGRTLSLNWSLWADGGMKLDEQTEILFRRNLGIKPLSKEAGLAAFTGALPSTLPHLAVLEGMQAKIERAWGLIEDERPASAATVAALPSAGAAGAEFTGDVTGQLSKTAMELLKLSPEDLSPDTILLDLGFDSIGLATFANAINDQYGIDINPVLFFEHPTIRAIAGVLTTEHSAAVERTHGDAGRRADAPPMPQPQAATDLDSVPAISKGWQEPVAPAAWTGLSRESRFTDEPIAIVGIAGVMPQSENLEAFWDHLKNARNVVTEIPRDRWIWEDYDGNPIKETNKSNSRWGGFMKEVDKFDPLFFGITPREAEMMDPQQRIFLETVWSAIEDSGHKVSDLAGTKTGLFVGASSKDYIDVLAENQSTLDGFSASGNSHSILANRISFLLNLRGPSAPLDTACSSSLVALHRAIESIHTGSSDMAIVGGVQVMLTPVGHISLSSAGMLSVDGKCKTFDKNANGYVRGEGSGAIFIKKLSQAEADGDPIYAVIKATAENHGGRVTMLTAPNPKAQAELLVECYEKARIDPTTVGYIECHGTGTSLGDPIEIQALKKSFADLYKKNDKPAPAAPHCALSSVKTNIGHLEPAAGIASLLKVLLSIKHKHIPALLHFEELNPYIDLDGSPFYIADRTLPWPAPTAADGAPLPRRAGVSSFGWGGANVHVVLEEYRAPQRRPYDGERRPQAMVLSAKNSTRLKAYALSLLAHLKKHPCELADLAYTLQVGRDAMEERLGVVVESVEQLIDKLQAYVAGATAVDGMFLGHVSRYKVTDRGLSEVGSVEGGRRSDIDHWLASSDHAKLLEAWVAGADVAWNRLHAAGSGRPRRLSLPTYAFARERHWIGTPAGKNVQAHGKAVAWLHPLLHTNISTLVRQAYSSTFSGREFFVADHPHGLPAAAYLEMARAAAVHARPMPDDAAVLELHDLSFTPAAADAHAKSVVIDLVDGRGGELGYEIHHTHPGTNGTAGKAVLCQGRIKFGGHAAQTRLDVRHILGLMTQGDVDATQLEAVLRSLTPQRGPSLRAIKAVHRGYQQMLVDLQLPPAVAHTLHDYVLHPATIDSVMQSALILWAQLDPVPGQPSLPVGLQTLQVLAPCPRESHAWVRPSRGSHPGDPTACIDVDLLDAQGTVCVRIKSLAFANPRFERARAGAREADFVALLESAHLPDLQEPPATAANAFGRQFEEIIDEIL